MMPQEENDNLRNRTRRPANILHRRDGPLATVRMVHGLEPLLVNSPKLGREIGEKVPRTRKIEHRQTRLGSQQLDIRTAGPRREMCEEIANRKSLQPVKPFPGPRRKPHRVTRPQRLV